MTRRTARGGPVTPVLAGVLLLTAALAGCGPGASSASPSSDSTSSPAAATTAGVTPTVAAGPTLTPSAPATRTTHPHYVFPVRAKTHFGPYHHDYPAVDIFAACGSTAVAPVSGTVDEVSRTDRWNPRTNKGADRGGLSVSIIGVDGVRYYGSHLRFIAADITPGRAVTAGQELGHVGNTGDARGIACHLHFGISPTCSQAGDWWIRRGVVSPYPFLIAWQAGRNTSPVATVKAWKAKNGCPQGPTTDP